MLPVLLPFAAAWAPPHCFCQNFVNGLTTKDVGQTVCAKKQAFDFSVATVCQKPVRPYLPFLDNGCPSDHLRCTAAYDKPRIEPCRCDYFANGAVATGGRLCIKHDELTRKSTCYPRNYDTQKGIGNAELFGCRSDQTICKTASPPSSPGAHRTRRSLDSSPDGNMTCPTCSALFKSTVAPPPSASALKTVGVAVAQCKNTDLSFLSSVETAAGERGLELRLVRIYSKCGVRPELPALGVPISISEVSNLGRNDQAWALYFAERYTQLADIILLLKDTHYTYPNPAHAVLAVPISTLFEEMHSRSFACARSPEDGLSVWHQRSDLWHFRIDSYTSASPDDHSVFERAKGDLPAFLKGSLTAEEFGRLERETLLPVCYGGSFAIRRSSVLTTGRDTWRKLAAALSRSNSLEEGHFMERTWAAMLSPALSSHPLGKEFIRATAQAFESDPDDAFLGAAQSCLC